LSHATYNVGVLDFDPPYVYSIDQGFDIDLTKAICDRLKTQCNLFSMNYQQFFTALDKGDIDFALGAIFINNDATHIFSLPYIAGLGQFMVLKNSSIQKVEDLRGKTIGLLKGNPSGNIFVNFLNQNYPGQFQLKDFDTISDLVDALNNQTIDAAFVRRSTIIYWTQYDGSLFKPIGNINPLGGGMGVMSVPQNRALIDNINDILKQMEMDGSYLNLYNIYFTE
jgi:arginine transport system substrate-binding protein